MTDTHTPHSATPEQWRQIEQYVADCGYDSCLVELRDRLAALEGNSSAGLAAFIKPMELTNEEADALHEGPGDSEDSESCARRIHRAGWNAAMAAVAAHQLDHSRGVTEMVPAGSLVEWVEQALEDHHVVGAIEGSWGAQSRAAILACATWLESQGVGAARAAARWLREEVERG